MNKNKVKGFVAIALSVTLVIWLGECSHRGKQPSETHHAAERQIHSFPEAQVPNVISDPEERYVYLADHYWDAFTDTSKVYYCDTNVVNGVSLDEVEEKMSTYSLLLSQIPLDDACEAVSLAFDRFSAMERKDTSSILFEKMTSLYEKYLYDPNSPLRNEDVYGAFAGRLAVSPLVDDNLRPAYAHDAEMCRLNRQGTPATDFYFKDINGKVHHLYEVDSPFTLLFFSNPGCHACQEIYDRLSSDSAASSMIQSGRLTVVNVYIDLEREKWAAFAKEYPKEWLSGYDHKYLIRTDQIYNVRAIPSLYLLDKDKKVMLKDAPEDRVFAALESIAAR